MNFFRLRGGSKLFLLAYSEEVVYEIESGNVKNEKSPNQERIEYGVTANEVEEDVVGGSVASHKEHVVVVDGSVNHVSGDAEARKNGKGDPHIALSHACHLGNDYVEGSEARYRMSDTRDDVNE